MTTSWPISLSLDLTPLLETSCKGVEKMGGLCFGGMLRRKESQDTLMAAQAAKDAQAIAAGLLRFDGEKCIPALQVPDMPALPLFLAIEQEQEMHNLAGNLQIAYEQLSTTPDNQISDEPVDPDWFARWRREAKLIGNPELQKLWGSVLAEEVKSPQSISMKTLDVLKNISKEEAELFCKIGKYACDFIFPVYLGGHPTRITFGDILTLVDCGLLLSTSRTGSLGSKSGTNRLLGGKHFVVCCHLRTEPPEDQSFIDGYKLSRAGAEILKIVEIPPYTEGEMDSLLQILYGTHKHSKINVEKYTMHPMLSPTTFDKTKVLFTLEA